MRKKFRKDFKTCRFSKDVFILRIIESVKVKKDHLFESIKHFSLSVYIKSLNVSAFLAEQTAELHACVGGVFQLLDRAVVLSYNDRMFLLEQHFLCEPCIS